MSLPRPLHNRASICPVLFVLLLGACSSTTSQPPVSAPQRLFLQQVSSSSAIIKWRGAARQACIGRKLKDIHRPARSKCEKATASAGNHRQAQFKKLEADTTYYYSVGGLTGTGQQFRTAPVTGSAPADGATRIWLIGDSGTASERKSTTGLAAHPGEAAAVYAGYKTYAAASGDDSTDLFLLLGDNAYTEGTDAQWQEAFFEVYPDLLKRTAVWPTIGNHEMGAGRINICQFRKLPQCNQGPVWTFMGGPSIASQAAAYDGDRDGLPDGTGMPYLDIFSLPTRAETGGVPSGTEQYYSFDYANVHVVSLDSQLSARDDAQRSTMRRWLTADLQANTQDWTIVIFHHPPYSKGANHDSDSIQNNIIDRPQLDMRQEFTPLFEAHGVDVVYSGHSHSYERSYYLRGHTGTSDTYSHAKHAELIAGNPKNPSLGQGTDSYAQLSHTSGGIDDRVVYTVAGNAGKADRNSGLTDAAMWLRHPAHITQAADPQGRNGLAERGSVVIDVTASELTARFINDNGVQRDYFVITR